VIGEEATRRAYTSPATVFGVARRAIVRAYVAVGGHLFAHGIDNIADETRSRFQEVPEP
jgi:hypothetical protein